MTEKRSKPNSNPNSMPVPGKPSTASQMQAPGTTGGKAPQSAMPIPGMSSTEPGNQMPRPGAAMIGGTPTQPNQPGAMPQPPGGHQMLGGPDLPRFPAPGESTAGRFEPGVIEVQFREGMMPSVTQTAGAPVLRTHGPSGPAGVTLNDVNQLLQRYQLVSAEPTFHGSVEEATIARETAVGQGVDVPHLRDFVTLHFPSDANVDEIADELSKLPQVERAVPVPVAIPPTEMMAEKAFKAMLPFAGEIEPDLEELPAGVPQSEPMVGTSDQVVVNSATHLEYQWYVFRCRINRAWTRSTGANVVVADVDWGYRTSHQDLAPRITRTYNAYDGTTNVTSGGSVSHGTGVMGLAGAAVNSNGIAGVAFESELWPVQADSGTGPALGGNAWARGIDWVRTTSSAGKRKVVILEVQTGAFGNYEQVPSVNAAIKTAIAAGVVVCVAAGNGNRDAGIDDSGNAIPPTGSILVGATSYDPAVNRRASFSNYGPNVVVAAPGDSAHDVTCHSVSDTAYRNAFGGTSGATPKVAGVAALMLSLNPALSHAQIRDLLKSTGTAVTTDAAKPVGNFLNAEAAVNAVSRTAVGRLEVFARGTDRAVWHRWQTAPNNGWSGWASMGGWVDIIRSCRNADGRLELIARGADQAVWHKWQTAPNNGWSGWASMGGWVDRLEVGQNQDGRLEVFARGSDGAVWHKWQTAPNNGWSGWASLGGWIDLLAIGQNLDGRLEIFARGSDGALWHKWQVAPNGGWSGWTTMGGWIDRLAVGRNADGRLEVFARGSDGAVWHNWQTAPNNGWSGWASMGGWIDLLSISHNADGRLELFARGSDRGVWHKWQTAPSNGWSGWASLGGWIDRLDVSQNADGRQEIFARGSDQALWHQWQTAPNGGWSGWASMGGAIDSIDVAQNTA